MPNVSSFASRHDLVLFVCGRKSSNGRVLFNECLRINPNTHLIEGPGEICDEWLHLRSHEHPQVAHGGVYAEDIEWRTRITPDLSDY